MKNPESCKNIEEVREAIDEIDYQIMKLFSQRYDFVKEIVKFKTDEASVIAESRQKEVIEKRREWAVELGLNPDLFEDIFWTLMRYNVTKELEILKNTSTKPV
ncbi:MAG: chorismate mutase [Prolixibacteraceae bacterium]|nr:chorismate mutase [Prolixibacteraceae bacterium]